MTMFERFTDEARTVVQRAVVEAAAQHAARTGTEHLLLAMLARPQSASALALQRHGLDLAGARAALADLQAQSAADDLDPDALRAIGIDLESVRASVEASFGEGTLDDPSAARARRKTGHVPFSPGAKKTLELSLREAIRLKQRSIADAHLLLGLLRCDEGLAAQVLAAVHLDRSALRDDLEQGLRQAG